MCVCVCVCVCVRRRSRAYTNRLIWFKINIQGPLANISSLFFFFFLVFPLPLKLRVVHIRKKFQFSQKWLQQFKFCEFIAHSKPNNMTLLAFPGKIPETREIVFNFFPSSKVALKSTDHCCSNLISGVLLPISSACFFRCRATPKIKGSSHKKMI